LDVLGRRGLLQVLLEQVGVGWLGIGGKQGRGWWRADHGKPILNNI